MEGSATTEQVQLSKTEQLSPKTVYAALVPVLAAVLLYLLTQNEEWLILVLGGFISGASSFGAPPAGMVKQAEIAELSHIRKTRIDG